MNSPSYSRLGGWMISAVLVCGLCGCQSQQPIIDELTVENAELQQQSAELKRENALLHKELVGAREAVQVSKVDAMNTIDDLVRIFADAKQAGDLRRALAGVQERFHDREAEVGQAQADARKARADADRARTAADRVRQENERLKAKIAVSELLESHADAQPDPGE